MASSGSFTTSTYSSRGLLFEWSVQSQSIANNTTTISWSLTGTGGGSTWYTSGNFKVTIDGQQVYYSSTRINLSKGTVVASGTYTISHSNDGTKSFSAYAEAGIYYVAVNCSGSGSWTLPSIPRQANITGANNFNSDANPYFTFNNAGGFTLNARLEFGGTSISRNGISNTGNYTFSLTSAERNLLYSKCASSQTLTVKYVLATVLNGTETWWSTVEKTMTVVNSSPTFSASNISYLDSNSTITAITGNNQHIVRNQSNLKVTFTSATAKNSASISKYEITLNGSTQTKTSATTIDYGTMNVSSNMTVTIKVTDSRGFTTSASKTITVLDWSTPSAIISLNRLNNYEDTSYLTVDATCYSVNSKNSIQSIKYKYKKTTATSYSAETSISNKTKYTLTLSKTDAWDFSIVIKDKFGTTTYNVVLAKGMPIMFIDTKKLSVGVNCFPSRSNSFEVNGKTMFDLSHPVGSIYRSTSSTNPSSTYGGTWTLLRSTPERIHIGSQEIYAGTSGNGLVSKTGLIGSYDYGTIDGVFANVSVPSGYHKEYRISFQGYTGNDTNITLYLNNIATNGIGTWSGNQFRIIGASGFFKQSDIKLETTLGYSRAGTNLYYSVTGTSSNWQFWGVTVHGYLVSNSTEYVWQRTA